MRTITDNPHARPEIDGAAEAIASWRDEDDPLAFCGLELVDGGLHGYAIVVIAVAVDVEFVRGKVHRRRVIEPRGIGRRSQAV